MTPTPLPWRTRQLETLRATLPSYALLASWIGIAVRSEAVATFGLALFVVDACLPILATGRPAVGLRLFAVGFNLTALGLFYVIGFLVQFQGPADAGVLGILWCKTIIVMFMQWGTTGMALDDAARLGEVSA